MKPPSDLTTLRDHALAQAEKDSSARRRALWTQIADELDAYLAPDDEQEVLL